MTITEYPKGGKQFCFVNPDKPHEAWLTSHPMWSIVAIGRFAVFGIILLYIVWKILYKRSSRAVVGYSNNVRKALTPKASPNEFFLVRRHPGLMLD